MVDYHVHILPGLDDGAASEAEFLAMAREAKKAGTTRLVATPHFLPGVYATSRELVLAGVAAGRRLLQESGVDLELEPGMEVYLSPEVPGLARQGRLLTLGDRGRWLLVELPFQEIPFYAEQVLFQLMLQGITPVLAHPERSRQVQEDQDWLARLVERGCLVQLNAGSLFGEYGRRVKAAAESLARRGLVHLLGSDAHFSGSRSLDLAAARRRLMQLQGARTTLLDAL